MNRELKFRIWDKSHDEFIIENGHGFHCYSNWSIDIFSGKLVDYVGAHDGDHSDTFIQQFAPDHFISPKKGFVKECPFIIQQYTGLKDKNGKEIYEVDIVKFRYEAYEHDVRECIGEVYFEDGIFFFDRKQSFAMNDSNFFESSLEVIGNIFENPELLK